MLKSIVLQLWNRKRSNSWMVLELVLVFCLIWYMVDYFFVLTCNNHIPNNRDSRHTWNVIISEYPPEYPGYLVEESEEEALDANNTRVLSALQNYQGIEAIAVSFYGSAPGQLSYSGGFSLCTLDDTTKIANGQQILIDTKTDYFRVFGLTTDNGKKPASARDFDWAAPNGIAVSRSLAEALFPDSLAVGKEVIYPHSDKRFIILGVIDDFKYFDYERPQNAVYYPYRLNGNSLKDVEISLRSNASLSDASFKEAFVKEMTKILHIGNYYLEGLTLYSQITDNAKDSLGITNAIRVRSYLMVFFLLNILLCVMGTFWYRVNLRRGEIGLRKALGSSSHSIRNLFFLEGLILLVIAAVVGMAIELQFVKAGLIDTLGQDSDIPTVYLPDKTVLRFLITNAITACILALVILAAIWLPAKKAASVPPVEALRDE
jgi:hypothetical protein